MKPCQNHGELLKARRNRLNLQLLAEGGTRQADEQVSGSPQIIAVNQPINLPSGVFISTQLVLF